MPACGGSFRPVRRRPEALDGFWRSACLAWFCRVRIRAGAGDRNSDGRRLRCPVWFRAGNLVCVLGRVVRVVGATEGRRRASARLPLRRAVSGCAPASSPAVAGRPVRRAAHALFSSDEEPGQGPACADVRRRRERARSHARHARAQLGRLCGARAVHSSGCVQLVWQHAGRTWSTIRKSRLHGGLSRG